MNNCNTSQYKPQKRYKRLVLLIAFSYLIISSGCYLERRMAYSLVKNSSAISILIIEPDVFLKTNLKVEPEDIEPFNTVAQKDSFAIAQSEFLKNVEMPQAYNTFMDILLQELRAYGVNVYTSAEIDTFFTLSGPAYIFNIAQVEMEEFYAPYRQEFERSRLDTVIYVQEFTLNAINFNTWIEFSELNSDKQKETLFSNFYISDEIEGSFFIEEGTRAVRYRYTRFNMQQSDVEQLIRFAGKTNARYIFNHILNTYVKENSPYTEPQGIFYNYNRHTGKIHMLEGYEQFRRL